MRHSRHWWPTLLRSRTRQLMTNASVLFVHWSVRQKLNRVSSVQLRRSVLAFRIIIVRSENWSVWSELEAAKNSYVDTQCMRVTDGGVGAFCVQANGMGSTAADSKDARVQSERNIAAASGRERKEKIGECRELSQTNAVSHQSLSSGLVSHAQTPSQQWESFLA